MNETEAGFIEAIADAPDDAGLRLVFSDWLLERGDPRGEYMRLAYEVAHGKPSKLVEKRAKKLAERVRGLPMFRLGGDCNVSHVAADGLLSQVTASVDQFFAHAPALFSLGPIHHLRLHRCHGRIGELAKFEPLRWVFGLELHDMRMNGGEAALLAASPHITRLRRFDLHEHPIGADGVAAIIAPLPHLHDLDISSTLLGPEGGSALARSPLMPRLTRLAIANNRLDASTVDALLTAARRLQRLHLAANRLGRHGGAAIAKAAHLTALVTLDLSSCDLENGGIAALAAAPHLSKLETLDLRGNNLGEAGAVAIETSPYFRSVRHLNLDGNHLTQARQRAILQQLLT